jgi:hypothetical protein
MNSILNIICCFYQGHYLYIYRQQQQLERVKKWLQLRNRDTDHRIKVEERRKKREEEAKVCSFFPILISKIFFLLFKAKFDEILRREKEREQRTNSQTTINLR